MTSSTSRFTPGASTTLVDAGPTNAVSGRPGPETEDSFVADDFNPLHAASSAVLAALRADESSPDADLYRRIAAGTCLESHMYRAAAGSEGAGNAGASFPRGSPGCAAGNGSIGATMPPPPAPTVRHVRSVPLPDFLTRELATTKLSSLMGLLPEAGLAWMSVDERLFLWAYDSAIGGTSEDISDYCCFSVPSGQCVVSVGLVRPKRGVFKATVEWCLVVNTPEEAILCAIAREATAGPFSSEGAVGGATSEPSSGSFGRDRYDHVLRLVPTSFVVPTDSIPILSVAGTDDGRIFLGGYDGRLYEMLYDSAGGASSSSGAAAPSFDVDDDLDPEDRTGPAPLHFRPPESLASTLALGTKRALSAAVFGPTPPPAKRARKCRKVSHGGSSFASAVVPGFVLRAASAVFGVDAFRRAGPIVSMTVDGERRTLYALTGRGYVHAFDLRPPPSSSSSSSVAGGLSFGGSAGPAFAPPPPRLTCTVNCQASGRLFLDTIAKGRTWPPPAPSDQSVALVTFPGGAAGARGAAGGMEGARALIKALDAEAQRRQQLRRFGAGATRDADRRGADHRRFGCADREPGVLLPVSIHVVPRSESKAVTLVAVTGGGVRYYLSALSSSAVNALQGNRGGNGDEMLRPGRRFTLCHVKAPPPYRVGADGEIAVDGEGSGSNGGAYAGRDGFGAAFATAIAPGLSSYRNAPPVERAFHGRDGVTLLAIESGGAPDTGGGSGSARNAIVALTPDPSRTGGRAGAYAGGAAMPASSVVPSSIDGGSAAVSNAGLGEVVSVPMASSGRGGSSSSALPGGRVWAIASATAASSESAAALMPSSEASAAAGSVRHLLSRSATPTDAELRVGLIPAYSPPQTPRATFSRRRDGGDGRAPPQNGNAAAAARSSLALTTALATTNGGRGGAGATALPAMGVVPYALDVVSRVLLRRPLYHPRTLLTNGGIGSGGGRVGETGSGAPPTYRVSRRVGSSALGFGRGAAGGVSAGRSSVAVARSRSQQSRGGGVSSSSGRRRGGRGSGASSSSTVARSARLSPWLLSPGVAPLPDWAKQHVSVEDGGLSQKRLLALNSGGLHYFAAASPAESLAAALMRGGGGGSGGGGGLGVGRDEGVRSFFEAYGYTEGCAMCLALAVGVGVGGGGSDALRKKAQQAALSYAHVPTVELAVGAAGSSGGARAHEAAVGGAPGIAAGVNGLPGGTAASVVPGLPPGYAFRPSNLHDGLLALLSRLLRPFWYKPAAVVTEGRTIVHHGTGRGYGYGLVAGAVGGGQYKTHTPARVELLLDARTAEEVRRPLAAFCVLMRDVFNPAVGSVPGVPNEIENEDEYAMDIDEAANGGGQRLITQAMRRSAAAATTTAPLSNGTSNDGGVRRRPTSKELRDVARLLEERSMHALYRLASRSCQLLSLLGHLREAQEMEDLPEVDWGALHGLTHYQLVSTREGQARMETVLTNLISGGMDIDVDTSVGGAMASSNLTLTAVSATGAAPAVPETARSDRLSLTLSRRCYLYYSSSSRLTYLGFRAARSAGLDPPGSARRTELSERASSLLVRAAGHWHDPALVAGRGLREESVAMAARTASTTTTTNAVQPGRCDELASRALRHGSPLARAARILAELGDVGGCADVCLRCAANFGGVMPAPMRGGAGGNDDGGGDAAAASQEGEMLPWERGLYHRPRAAATASGSSASMPGTPSRNGNSGTGLGAVVSGLEVTPRDALATCHAVVFHHLGNLLNAASRNSQASELSDRMLSVCSSSSDPTFLRSLYTYLLSSSHADALLRIDSPALEAWLRYENGDVDLLWRYYVRNGRDALAGDTMKRRGCATDARVPLEERIDCLTKAHGSLLAACSKGEAGRDMTAAPFVALPGGAAGANASYGRGRAQMHTQVQTQRAPHTREELVRMSAQIREQLEVAHLQRRVLAAVSSAAASSSSSSSAAILDDTRSDALSHTLVTATDLYNDYAAPLSLYDLCLLMLCTCGNSDRNAIATLWRSVLSEEVLPCVTRSAQAAGFLADLGRGSMVEEECRLIGDGGIDGATVLFEDGDWMPRLTGRVASLGRELCGKGADYTFPLDLLVECLEGLRRAYDAASATSAPSKPWPLQIFVDAGLRFPSLLEAYDEVLFSRGSGGGGGGMLALRGQGDSSEQLKRLASIGEVVRMWTDTAFSPAGRSSVGIAAVAGGGGESMGNGTSGAVTAAAAINDAFTQLSQAVSSGGLRPRIDAYKSSLESFVVPGNSGGGNDEVSRVHSMFRDAEDAIWRKI